jgi:hypothetical protein
VAIVRRAVRNGTGLVLAQVGEFLDALIFGKLGIAEAAGYSRRVLAVLRYLGS